MMLHEPRRRVWCDGPSLERLGMAWCSQRVTAGLAQACGHLWRHCTVRAVAAFYDMGWHTVKWIDKTRLRGGGGPSRTGPASAIWPWMS